jgi:hypothetical protein
MIAYLFLQSRRLKAAGRKKKESGDRRHNPACQRSDRPSSTSSSALHPDDAHTVISPLPSPSITFCQSSARVRTR